MQGSAPRISVRRQALANGKGAALYKRAGVRGVVNVPSSCCRRWLIYRRSQSLCKRSSFIVNLKCLRNYNMNWRWRYLRWRQADWRSSGSKSYARSVCNVAILNNQFFCGSEFTSSKVLVKMVTCLRLTLPVASLFALGLACDRVYVDCPEETRDFTTAIWR